MVRSRQTFHQVQPRYDRGRRSWHLRLIEKAQARVEADGHADRIVLEGGPVKAAKANEAVRLAGRRDIDVVAALAIDVVGSTVTFEDVVALHRLIAKRIEVIARRAVAGAASRSSRRPRYRRELVALGAEYEVIAWTAKDLGSILAGDDEVLTEAAEQDVGAAHPPG